MLQLCQHACVQDKMLGLNGAQALQDSQVQLLFRVCPLYLDSGVSERQEQGREGRGWASPHGYRLCYHHAVMRHAGTACLHELTAHSFAWYFPWPAFR